MRRTVKALNHGRQTSVKSSRDILFPPTNQDIINVINIDIKNLSKCITIDMIVERKRCNINWNKLYEGVLCE